MKDMCVPAGKPASGRVKVPLCRHRGVHHHLITLTLEGGFQTAELGLSTTDIAHNTSSTATAFTICTLHLVLLKVKIWFDSVPKHHAVETGGVVDVNLGTPTPPTETAARSGRFIAKQRAPNGFLDRRLRWHSQSS
jgi:hypothetical protein